MKTTNKFLAALVIVMSVASVNAASKTDDVGIFCKISNIEMSRKFQVVFNTVEARDVRIRINSESGRSVYDESLTNVGNFSKVFEMSRLADGIYTISVSAGDFTYSEDVLVESWKAENLHLLNRDGRKIAMIGKNDSGTDVVVRVVDRTGDILHSRTYANKETIKQLYDMSELRDNAVSVEIFANNELVKSHVVE